MAATLTEQGLAIRSARLARNMTQSVLADAAGVSEKTVRRAECGERIQAETVMALCAVLALDPTQLRSEAEMLPETQTAQTVHRVRRTALMAATTLSLVAASVTAVLIARSGGGVHEAQAVTIDTFAFNAYAMGFAVVSLVPRFPVTRRVAARVPGLAALGRRLAPLEPYGFALVMGMLCFSFAVMLPFQLADGWSALTDGGRTAPALVAALTLAMTILIGVMQSRYVAESGSERWGVRASGDGAPPVAG